MKRAVSLVGTAVVITFSLVGTAFADTNTTASTTAATQNQALAASGLSPEQIIQNNLGQLPGISKWEFKQHAATTNSMAAQVSLPGLRTKMNEGDLLLTERGQKQSLASWPFSSWQP